MILSDTDIVHMIQRDELSIKPLHQDSLQPASVDLRLADKFLMYPQSGNGVSLKHIIDPYEPVEMELLDWAGIDGPFILYPHSFVLAASQEWMKLSSRIVGFLDGKSSLARLGIQVHAAGKFDPGFEGTATLEITNFADRPIRLYPGMKIAHIFFMLCLNPARFPYGHPSLNSKYQGQVDPTGSRFHLNAKS